MTDKELIKQEIESYKESMKCLRPYSDFRKGQITAYNQILQFIDSLPEEPKKQPKFKVGDTIKGPCNNVFQVKEVLDTQYLLHSENGDELNSIEIVDKYSCISEEPFDYTNVNIIPKDFGELPQIIEQAAVQAHIELEEGNGLSFVNIFSKGAEWQNNQMKETLQTEYEKGRFDMREEMMKDGIKGEIGDIMPLIEIGEMNNYLSYVKAHKLKEGDKVKIIIIKEECHE